MMKGKKKHSEETKQASEPDPNMAQILELSDSDFEITTINLLRDLMGKVTDYKNRWVI